MNLPAVGAAIAASILTIAHGGVGHGWHRAQLRDVAFKPTALVGDADAAHRFFQVTWHIVTTFFLATAIALFAIAFGAYTNTIVLQFIAVTYGVVIGVALTYFAARFRAIVAPIPSIAAASMVAVIVLCWLAA